MNFPKDYFTNPSRVELNDKYNIENINEKIKEAIIELDKNKDKNFIYVRSVSYFFFVHKCDNNKEYTIVVVPSEYYSCITTNDELIKQGILPKTLKQAQIGDIILGSNDKKYKILDDINENYILLLDIEANKIVEGWNKKYFFDDILGEKLSLIRGDEEDIFPVKIDKE